MKKNTVGWLEIGSEERAAVNQVLSLGRISEGPKTHEFEKKWAKFIGTDYCVATSSGTGALITALTVFKNLHNLKNRTKVITSPLTYISDVNAIVLSGLEPVFVDIDPDTFCIVPEGIESLLQHSENKELYSILLPVDLMGFSVDLAPLKRIAVKYGLLLLEDAAEAHGTIHNGKICGSNADAGIFSFYIAHNIQAGEMGAITTDNYEIYRLAKKIKSNGRSCECKICTREKGICSTIQSYKGEDDFDPRFLHDLIGYNFKTTEFQAAIALVQLKRIKKIIKIRQKNVEYLNERLMKYRDILQLPLFNKNTSYMAYPIVIKKPEIISRKKLRWELEKKGVETRPLFGCIPTQQPAYHYLRNSYLNKLPNAEYIGRNGFYIGCHQYLKEKDLDTVVGTFEHILG